MVEYIVNMPLVGGTIALALLVLKLLLAVFLVTLLGGSLRGYFWPLPPPRLKYQDWLDSENPSAIPSGSAPISAAASGTVPT